MLLEITSISNFLVHVARCADIISEEQLILLNNNIIQTLKCFYTNFWDINDIHLHDKYRQINIVNNAIDIKIQKAIIKLTLYVSHQKTGFHHPIKLALNFLTILFY